MNARVIGLEIVLLGFLALTGYAVYQHGYVGFFEWANYNSATRLMFVDLAIGLTLILAWMWNDARSRGLSVLPYAVLTLAFGAAGPLAYLIRREIASLRAGAVQAAATRA
jgi:hypothetical protein